MEKKEKIVVQKAKFEEIEKEAAEETPREIERLYDVPMEVSVRLGKTTLSIGELLKIGPGSVIELDSVAGGTVDILVNNKVFARGEVIVIDDRFGVRITSLVSPEERVRKLI